MVEKIYDGKQEISIELPPLEVPESFTKLLGLVTAGPAEIEKLEQAHSASQTAMRAAIADGPATKERAAEKSAGEALNAARETQEIRVEKLEDMRRQIGPDIRRVLAARSRARYDAIGAAIEVHLARIILEIEAVEALRTHYYTGDRNDGPIACEKLGVSFGHPQAGAWGLTGYLSDFPIRNGANYALNNLYTLIKT